MDEGFYLVRRPKCLVRHYGVAAVVPGRPTEVFELLPEGYRVSDLETFGAGRTVTFGERRPLAEAPAIRARLASLGRGWNLCTFNCEHAARWALTGRRESRQLPLWGGVAAAVLVAFGLLARR